MKRTKRCDTPHCQKEALMQITLNMEWEPTYYCSLHGLKYLQDLKDTPKKPSPDNIPAN